MGHVVCKYRHGHQLFLTVIGGELTFDSDPTHALQFARVTDATMILNHVNVVPETPLTIEEMLLNLPHQRYYN